MRECFAAIYTTATSELAVLDEYVVKLAQDPNSEKTVPRSSDFDLFADELIKRCCGEDASNLYDDPH